MLTAVPTTSPPQAAHIRRSRLAGLFLLAAKTSLALLIITLPWRQQLVLLARPSPPIYPDFTNLLLPTHTIFLLLLLLAWGGSLLLQPRRLRVGPFFIWWPLLGITTAAAIGVIAAVDPFLAGYHVLQVGLLDLLYLFIINEVTGWKWVGTAVALQILLQAAIAIGQAWQQHDLGLAWLGERALSPQSGSIVWAQGGLQSLRAYGLTDHPNILGISLALGLLLLATWYLQAAGHGHILALVIFSLGSVALFLTFSRSAWISFGWGTLWVTAVCFKKSPQRLSRWLAPIGFSLLLLLPVIWQNLPYLRLGADPGAIAARVEERLSTQTERAALNRAADQLFSDHALTGTGLGTFPLALRRAWPDFAYDYQPARMTFITSGAEIGLFGELFYFLAVFAPWVVLILRRDRLAFSPALIGLSSVLLAVTIFGLVDAYPWFYPAGRLWQWLIWGLWAGAYEFGLEAE